VGACKHIHTHTHAHTHIHTQNLPFYLTHTHILSVPLPPQRGTAGRYRILLPRGQSEEGGTHRAGGSTLSPNGYAWGVTLKEESGGGWVVEREDEVISRMQALQVSLGKVRSVGEEDGGGGGVGGGSAVQLIVGKMWFEVVVTNGNKTKKSAVRSAPFSDECLLGMQKLCVYVRVSVYIYIYALICVCIYLYTHMCVCIYVCIHMFIGMRVCLV